MYAERKVGASPDNRYAGHRTDYTRHCCWCRESITGAHPRCGGEFYFAGDGCGILACSRSPYHLDARGLCPSCVLARSVTINDRTVHTIRLGFDGSLDD